MAAGSPRNRRARARAEPPAAPRGCHQPTYPPLIGAYHAAVEKPKPEIRPATPDDAVEIARLRWEFSLEERDPTESREQFHGRMAEDVRRFLASGRWSIWVAAESSEPDRLLATLFLQRVEKVPRPYPRPAAWGYVTNVYVDATWRNRGLGKAVLDVAIAAARAAGLDTLLLWPSSRAIPFYERAGFASATGAMELPLDES